MGARPWSRTGGPRVAPRSGGGLPQALAPDRRARVPLLADAQRRHARCRLIRNLGVTMRLIATLACAVMLNCFGILPGQAAQRSCTDGEIRQSPACLPTQLCNSPGTSYICRDGAWQRYGDRCAPYNTCGSICPRNPPDKRYHCRLGGPVGGTYWSSTPCSNVCLSL